ncbi:MAG: hypothetical protein K2H49_10285, partial [Muribaculaceae bacterium]|nr:hypothetical protein [Muribaculaceae bacterium]
MASVRLERMKLVLTDWITANISFILFNILRYFEQSRPSFTFDAVCNYLLQTKICIEQVLVPIAILAVYWLSGFYNNPFGKSRFGEFLNTAVISAINTIILHLALLTNDQMSDISSNLLQILMIFFIFFLFTFIGRLIVINNQIRHFQRRDWKYSAVIVGNSPKAHDLAKKMKYSKVVISHSIAGCCRIPGEPDPHEDAYDRD